MIGEEREDGHCWFTGTVTCNRVGIWGQGLFGIGRSVTVFCLLVTVKDKQKRFCEGARDGHKTWQAKVFKNELQWRSKNMFAEIDSFCVERNVCVVCI